MPLLPRTMRAALHNKPFRPSKPSGMREGGPMHPKLLTVLRSGYTAKDFSKDLIAGITVGIVAMPLAMAFAIASGLTPIHGLYTAIIAGIVIGFMGGSRVQVSGPTGAFVVIIYSIVYRHGYDGLVITTILAGLILIVAGLCRLGSIIKFIPYPVTTGFTAGIAVIIFSSQIPDFFGFNAGQVPPEFFEKWALYFQNMGGLSWLTTGVAAATLVVMLIVRRFKPSIPAPVVGVLFGAGLVWLFGLPVETVASKFGAIPAELPSFHWPAITLERIQLLFPDAVTIALLAGIESLLTCVVADSMTGDRHYSNMELVAQGTGNLASALFGGIPATGAIARTSTNIFSGARSPVSAIIHGFTVLLFVLWLSPLTSAIPLASLAAVMLIIAYGMVEMKAVKTIMRGPASDWAVMLLTFGLTVVLDLTVAVYMGVIVASLLFMSRMSNATSVKEMPCENFIGPMPVDVAEGIASDAEEVEGNFAQPAVPEGVRIFNVNGPFFFGMVDRFQNALSYDSAQTKVFIINMQHVSTIDASGIHVLESFLAHRSDGYRVVLAGAPAPTRRILRRMGLLNSLGADNVCYSLEAALVRAAVLVGNLSHTGHTEGKK